MGLYIQAPVVFQPSCYGGVLGICDDSAENRETLVTPQLVFEANCSTDSDNKSDIMTTFGFWLKTFWVEYHDSYTVIQTHAWIKRPLNEHAHTFEYVYALKIELYTFTWTYVCKIYGKSHEYVLK